MGGFLFNIGKFLAIIIKPQTLKQTSSQTIWVPHTPKVFVCAGFTWLVSVVMQVFCVFDCGIVEFLVVIDKWNLRKLGQECEQVVHIAFWGKQVLQCHSHLH